MFTLPVNTKVPNHLSNNNPSSEVLVALSYVLFVVVLSAINGYCCHSYLYCKLIPTFLSLMCFCDQESTLDTAETVPESHFERPLCFST